MQGKNQEVKTEREKSEKLKMRKNLEKKSGRRIPQLRRHFIISPFTLKHNQSSNTNLHQPTTTTTHTYPTSIHPPNHPPTHSHPNSQPHTHTHTRALHLLQLLEHGRRTRLRRVAVLDDRLAELARELSVSQSVSQLVSRTPRDGIEVEFTSIIGQ